MSRRSNNRNQPTLAGSFQQVKADYAAAMPSRFRRNRNGLGGTADAHITDEQFRRVREYVRDMDRNDAIIGQLVDRAVDNTVRNGFELRPQTGDEALDIELKALWDAWASDSQQCDVAGRFTFPQMERMVLRHQFIDGDVFVLPTDTGALQMIEGDWCVTAKTTKNVRLGVRLDARGKPIEYWFAKSYPRDARMPKFGDIEPIPAVDADGQPQVFHICKPKRITETRSLSVFAPVFDICGMIEDVNFAQVVKQQICSFFGVFFTRSEGSVSGGVPQVGSQSTGTRNDGTTETIEELEPGMAVDLPPGVKPEMFNAQIPNAEFFTHLKMLLRLVACNLGLPYVLAMLDTTDTTFHGYRGELNQAQIGFECNQSNLEQRFHRHVYRWKVGQWMEAGLIKTASAGEAVKDGRLFRHKWSKPAWKSVDPKSDAESNSHRIQSLQASPTQIAAEQGLQFDDVIAQSAKDAAETVFAFDQQAKDLRDKYGIDISWEALLAITARAQVNTSQVVDPSQQTERTTGKPAKPTSTSANNRIGHLLNGAASHG